MKPFVTCAQMKLLEKLADESGLSYYQMMENAGTRAFQLICEKFTGAPADAKLIIFCGKGNNGGDGFVVARKFYELGAAITVVLVDGEPTTPDAITNYQLIKDKIDVSTMEAFDASTPANIIVDAIYGTGFHGQLRPNGLNATEWINQQDAMVCALDIPSGLSGDAESMEICDYKATKADITITFHNKKPVHLQDFAVEYCGEVLIADIEIDEDSFEI